MTENHKYPFQPLLKYLTELKRLLEDDELCPDYALEKVGLRRLFSQWQQTGCKRKCSRNSETVIFFCNNLLELSMMEPDPTIIWCAPLLNSWCAITSEDYVRLLGRVSGHPRLREHARIRTSPLLHLSSDRSWARSYNRFYTLGQHDTSMFFRVISDGLIPSSTNLIEIGEGSPRRH
ncbi:DUF6634 family protein [Roseovarius sp.]|uniref:DUF6634 family protein n=1 Tax=Roseovarius sp. TaxID=1486281 RepID=UPI003567DC7E